MTATEYRIVIASKNKLIEQLADLLLEVQRVAFAPGESEGSDAIAKLNTIRALLVRRSSCV